MLLYETVFLNELFLGAPLPLIELLVLQLLLRKLLGFAGLLLRLQLGNLLRGGQGNRGLVCQVHAVVDYVPNKSGKICAYPTRLK